MDSTTAGGRNVTFDTGLIPEYLVLVEDGSGLLLSETNMDLVLAAATMKDEVDQEDLNPFHDNNTSNEEEHQAQGQEVGSVVSSYSAIHTKSCTSNPEGNLGNNVQIVDVSASPLSAVHTKSVIRGSSSPPPIKILAPHPPPTPLAWSPSNPHMMPPFTWTKPSKSTLALVN